MEKNSSRLMALRCQKCYGLFVPPRYSCPKCSGRELQEVPLSGKGRIMTYTTIRVPPLGFENQVPYKIAIVELSEGINLTVRLEAKGEEDPKIGADAVFLRKESGTHWFGLSS